MPALFECQLGVGLGLPASPAWLVKGEAHAVSRMLDFVLKISSKYPAIEIDEARPRSLLASVLWKV